MRYWAPTLIGLVIAGAAVVAIDWGTYHVVRTGTCASGGPYVSARPCPPGTGGHIAAIVAGSFGAFIGMAVYAARGRGARRSPFGLGIVVWSLVFLTIAGSVALGAFGPAGTGGSDAKTAAVIIGVIFVPMGLAPFPFGAFVRRRQQRARELVEHGSRCPGRVLSVEDTGIRINDRPRVRITVQAEPPGEPPFTIVKTATMPLYGAPRPGERCTVFYDPADRERRNGVSFDAAPVTPEAPAATSDEDDPLEKIEKLGELRAKGLLTQEEFDEQKRRLLGEL